MKVPRHPIGSKKDWKVAVFARLRIVVDVTNWVLLETGHPLHAFDFDKIQDGEVIVRLAKPKEICDTLDGKTRELDPSMLVIADKNKTLAIAGVMGGSNSQVSDMTTRVLIEAAYFDPSSLRKTSKSLQLQSDSSKRFERGVDPNQINASLDIGSQAYSSSGRRRNSAGHRPRGIESFS